MKKRMIALMMILILSVGYGSAVYADITWKTYPEICKNFTEGTENPIAEGTENPIAEGTENPIAEGTEETLTDSIEESVQSRIRAWHESYFRADEEYDRLEPLSAPQNAVSGAAAYSFDTKRTALEQLEELFTTIDLMDATIADLSREMQAGNVTSEEITQMYIDRILAYDAPLKLNSVISINPNALTEARILDEERMNGLIRGPLHGIPIIIKDNIDLAGTATTAGSIALAHMVSDTDAFVVKQLKNAGAVIVAKANLSEFASSAIDSKSLLGGTVHNAYDISRVPAGSSGGTAVAVTSNFAAAGLGTDTGGSIRNPSSYSNLYGIRPSKGLTSVHGVIPLDVPRDTVGPMTRTAEDMALVLGVIAGTDENDDFTLEAGADELVGSGYMEALDENGLQGMRIGYVASSFEYYPPVSQSEDETQIKGPDLPGSRVDAMIKRTRADLRKAGAEFVDLSKAISDDKIFEMMDGASDLTTEYDFNKYLYEKGDLAPQKTLKALYLGGMVGIDFTNLPVQPGEIDQMADSFETTVNPYDTQINGYMRGKTWQITLDGRKTVTDLMDEYDVDAIMYMASFDVPPTYENTLEELYINRMGWAYGFVFGPALGMPEMVLPMGFSDPDEEVSTELPLGMRFAARFGDEQTLMKIAYAYEKQAGASVRKMPANTPALPDPNLAAFLDALMEQVYCIDYDRYNTVPAGKVKVMESAWEKAAAADASDPYAVFKAAEKLAVSYDSVMQALKDSGEKKAKQPMLVTTKTKSVSYKKLKKSRQTVNGAITVKKAKGTVTYAKVTNGSSDALSVNKKTGDITVKKGTKKGTYRIRVRVTAAGNSRYKSGSKTVTVKISVK